MAEEKSEKVRWTADADSVWGALEQIVSQYVKRCPGLQMDLTFVGGTTVKLRARKPKAQKGGKTRG